MKKSRFTETQIVSILKQAAAGTAAQTAGNAEDKASRGLSDADRSASELDPESPNFEQDWCSRPNKGSI